MSNDFEKVLITDDKLDFKNKIKFGVFRGGSSVNYQTFAALSATPNSQVYSVQVPSESVAVDRRVLWRCQVQLEIKGPAGRAVGEFLINYGKTDAFAPFPLHNCVQNMSAQINSTQVNFQTEDLLLPIQKMFSEEDLGHYNSYTPTYQDKYFDYANGVNANNNPLGSYNNSPNSKLLPRGSWVIDSISSSDAGLVPVVATDNTVYVTATFTEPLMMSPFTYAPCENDEVGLYGIQSISFNINMLTNPRIWRNSNGYVNAVSIKKFASAELLFNFISPPSSQLIASRQPVKYYEIPRFTNQKQQILANDKKQLNSATIQLNSIPQFLIIWARKAATDRVAYRDADQFFNIDALTIQFNNTSGILSSSSNQDLYRMSAHNHLHMPYLEWLGKANSNVSNANSGYNQVTLCSGPIILEFCKDIVVNESYLSIGSLGNFNLQVSANVNNRTAVSQNVELCIATVNPGLFITERGTSSSYTGILTRQDVLDVQNQEPLPEADMKRMVGKGFVENLSSMLRAGVANAPKVIEKICEIAPSLAKSAKSLMGDGRAGAGMSGGLMKRLK